MKPIPTFKSFLVLEWKRAFTGGKIGMLVLLWLIFLILTFFGIRQYQDIQEDMEKFNQSEDLKVELMVSYEQYGAYGVRAYFMPSPILVFFNNSSLFTELTGEVDSGAKLNLYTLFKGRKVFSEKASRYFDFSGVVLLIGSLMALIYGYKGFKKKEYLKFLSSILGYRKTYWYTWFSRLTWLCAYFFAMTIASTIVVILFVLPLDVMFLQSLLLFQVLVFLVLIFFYAIGTWIGSHEKWELGVVFGTWFLLVFLLPSVINKIIEWTSGNIPDYQQSELDKLDVVKKFEDEAIAAYSVYKGDLQEIDKEIQNIVQSHPELQPILDSEKNNQPPILNEQIKSGEPYKKLLEAQKKKSNRKKQWDTYVEQALKSYDTEVLPKLLDPEVKSTMDSHIQIHRTISLIFPSTFYLYTNSELSSGGYENIMAYYERVSQLKQDFIKFITAKINEGAKYKKPIANGTFLKTDGEKNIFFAQSESPGMLIGVCITMLWILLVLIRSYRLFHRAMFSVKKVDGFKPIKIDLADKSSNVILTQEPMVAAHLFNVLSGENNPGTGFDGEIKRGDKNIAYEKAKLDFIYLCHVKEVPSDIKTQDFTHFISPKLDQEIVKELKDKFMGAKYLHDLPEEERTELFFKMVKTFNGENGIYFLNDYLKEMPPYMIQKFVQELNDLKEKGATILYVTNNIILGRRLADFLVFRDQDKKLLAMNF